MENEYLGSIKAIMNKLDKKRSTGTELYMDYLRDDNKRLSDDKKVLLRNINYLKHDNTTLAQDNTILMQDRDRLLEENKVLRIEIADLKNKIAKLEEKKGKLPEKRKYSKRSEQEKIFYRDYDVFRKSILERDGYCCQNCGSKYRLQVHHIKSRKQHPELIMDADNCITLCIVCHSQTENFFVT